MICKHCGYIIAPSDLVCKNCGKAISLSGGNGFWDIAGEPKPVDPPQLQPPIHKPVVKEPPKNNNLPIAVCLGLCFVMIVVFVAGRISNKNAVSRLKSNYELKLSDQQANYESQIAQMESKIDSLEEEIRQLSEPRMPVIVKSPPTDETKQVGYINAAESWLFGFVIEGSAVSFQWEKQQVDGEWCALEFDEWNIDRRYGLKCEQNLQLGSSKLVAVGLTPESDGRYRCTVTTEHGSTSAEVMLTIEQDTIDGRAPLSSVPTSIPADTIDRKSETAPINEGELSGTNYPEEEQFLDRRPIGEIHS